jgi:hypothetical protein
METAPGWIQAIAYDKAIPLYVDLIISVPCALLYAAEMIPIIVKPTNDFRSAFFRIFAARTFVVSLHHFTNEQQISMTNPQ